MKSYFKLFLVFLAIAICITQLSCEKEITVDLPTAAPKIVVEGSIEQGQPPIIFLSWSQGYFEPTDISSIQDYFIRDAVVKVNDGDEEVTLTEICTSELTEEQLALISELLGFSPEEMAAYDICAYTSLTMVGEVGKVYSLTVNYEEHHVSSQTKINNIVQFDSLWFEVISADPTDSLGFVFGIITDPDTAGNAYRWFAKRISHYPEWENSLAGEYQQDLAGQPEDFSYIAPNGSVFDDEFFNGLTFEFGYYRDAILNSYKRDDYDIERGYFKRGDTIAVRGCVIDKGAFDFLSSFEDQQASQGSPFSIPFNLKTNIVGGLGGWIGYGAVYDTVICE
ncbi:MAG: DUF4249 family protein [Flavobacteriales bacterium]|nr:DUF4249 family protein [Flavobacteriales bacterium]